MILDCKEEVIEYLKLEGLIQFNDHAKVEHLSGGVSCRVWKVTVNSNRWVIKQALEKLDVKADWFSDVERIHREHEVMKQLELVIPECNIPKILHVDYVNHIYLMTCAEEGAETWKECLMSGIFNADSARSAVDILNQIHIQSHRMDEKVKAGFSDQKYFNQLRIDPFHRFLIPKYPELSDDINGLIKELTEQKTCLVHGDFSPKNMLVEKSGKIVLIDYEVAHWGNPIFDLAYCLGHLMLKAWHLNNPEQLLKLISIFFTDYKGKFDNLLPHLGLMLLARMDGKSPVNYIQDENLKQIIRTVGINWIKGVDSNLDVFEAIKKQF
jgi:aminoglycoside phosphotransferase (APT) family kinase protein